MVFQCLYVSVTRFQFGEITKTINAVLRHDALEGVHVHENTLCATFGAPRFRTHFRILTRCFEYAAFHMLSRTHVRRTTLCVTFGARRRSIPSGLLDHQGRPRTPEWSRRATVWVASVAQGCHPNLISSRAQRHPDLRSGIFRRRERHAHEMARRHRAGSGDRENPKQGGANTIPGLPVMTGPP